MLTTGFTRRFGVRHPIALAPMGGSAGGALAAAVSRGGGLGLLGSGDGDPQWPAREAPIVAGTGLPWGVGFLTWAVDVPAVERALEYRPRAVMSSFGDPRPYAEVVHRAGAALIVQVADVAQAHRAVDAAAGRAVGGRAGRAARRALVAGRDHPCGGFRAGRAGRA